MTIAWRLAGQKRELVGAISAANIIVSYAGLT